jgi:hypothetical protein
LFLHERDGKVKRKIVVGILAVVCLVTALASAAPAVGATKEVEMTAVMLSNGKMLSASAYRVGDALYLPLRASAEAFGLVVNWQSKPAAALVKTSYENEVVTLLIGEDAILINSSTYVPGFFFTDTLGLTLNISKNKIELAGKVGDDKASLYRQFRFDNDAEGFEPIFADYMLDSYGLDKYEMASDYKKIPVTGAESYGLYIASHNRSDDIFMGYVKEISGLAANTAYTFQIDFRLATEVEGGGMGIGGSAGESVYVKAGVTAEYPRLGTAPDGAERILNVDTGIQARDGKDLIVIGNVTKPDGSAGGFAFKEMSAECSATTDADGRAYLIIGTDSGFEGFTEYYLDDITLLCLL